jgi:competence protein ComEA
MQPKVKAACTTCHNTSRITEQHRTRQQWSAQLEKMEGLGAVIPDADRNAFLNYLTKNFGPEKGAAKVAGKPAAKKSGSAAD